MQTTIREFHWSPLHGVVVPKNNIMIQVIVENTNNLKNYCKNNNNMA